MNNKSQMLVATLHHLIFIHHIHILVRPLSNSKHLLVQNANRSSIFHQQQSQHTCHMMSHICHMMQNVNRRATSLVTQALILMTLKVLQSKN